MQAELDGKQADLGAGTEDQALLTKSGVPTWSTLPSGVTTFQALSDTPGAYTGHADKIVVVNSGANALEFTDTIDGGTY